MARKTQAEGRETPPDPKYASRLVTKLINRVMVDGKRSVAERIVYDALADIGGRTQGGDPLSVVERAVDNVEPSLEVKSRRVGGATYQVPMEVDPARSTTLALRWMVGYARIRREPSMPERVAAELLDASNGVGAAVQRKEDAHKMAEANRAFAHYRW